MKKHEVLMVILLAVLVIFSVVSATRSANITPPQKWDYKVEKWLGNDHDRESYMNGLAGQGWELDQFQPIIDGAAVLVVFRRPHQP